MQKWHGIRASAPRRMNCLTTVCGRFFEPKFVFETENQQSVSLFLLCGTPIANLFLYSKQFWCWKNELCTGNKVVARQMTGGVSLSSIFSSPKNREVVFWQFFNNIEVDPFIRLVCWKIGSAIDEAKWRKTRKTCFSKPGKSRVLVNHFLTSAKSTRKIVNAISSDKAWTKHECEEFAAIKTVFCSSEYDCNV